MARRTSRISLDQLPPRARAEAERQLAEQDRLAVQPVTQVEAEPSQRRIRQAPVRKLTRLESDYQDKLRVELGEGNFESQNIRLQLANGQWYKPDFFIPAQLLFIEMKGPKSFRGGFENLKTAAQTHKWAKFRLVWRERRGGPWLYQEVLPI